MGPSIGKDTVNTRQEPAQSDDSANDNNRLQYLIETHKYINFLNDAADKRANTLLVANSVLLAGILNVNRKVEMGHGIPMDFTIPLMLAGIFLLISTMLCVWSVLPRAFDIASPIHISAISRMSQEMYTERSCGLGLAQMIRDFSRENFVVSKIVMLKRKYIKRGVYLLYAGILTAFSTSVLQWLQLIIR